MFNIRLFFSCRTNSFYSRTPGNAKGNSGLNPEADEFVPVFTVNYIFIHILMPFLHSIFLA